MIRRMYLAVALLLVLSPITAFAHGGLGHIQVTAWAAENLPEGELRTFLAQPEIFNSLLFGAAYTDIGYYPGLPEPELVRALAEYSHWTPFTKSFIDWIVENDPPPWTTLESRKRVAFLIGNAAHGLQDEVFDSLFLDQVSHHDGAGQPEADPATDGFLAIDALIGLVPKEGVPVSALLDLYNSSGELEKEVTEDLLLDCVHAMAGFYIDKDAGPALATIAANRLMDVLIWTRDNYMNPDVPGSLHAEVWPTMQYMEAIWKQLNGTYGDDDVIMFSFPEPERRMRSHVAGPPDSWVSVLFSTGVNFGAMSPVWKDSEDNEVSYELDGHQWGGDLTRIMRIKPTEDLTPGGNYTLSLNETDVPAVDDTSWNLSLEMAFQVACDESNADDCPDTGEAPEARLDGAADYQAEWTDETSWEEEVPEPEPEEESGCVAMGVNLNGFLLLMGLGLLMRRRRSQPHA